MDGEDVELLVLAVICLFSMWYVYAAATYVEVW